MHFTEPPCIAHSSSRFKYMPFFDRNITVNTEYKTFCSTVKMTKRYDWYLACRLSFCAFELTISLPTFHMYIIILYHLLLRRCNVCTNQIIPYLPHSNINSCISLRSYIECYHCRGRCSGVTNCNHFYCYCYYYYCCYYDY